LWLITADGDYCTKHGKDYFLNPMLRREIAGINVSCFGTLAEGIDDFAKYSGAGREQLPTESEMVEIKEEESLSAAVSAMPFIYPLEVMPRPQYRTRFIHRPDMDQVGWISIPEEEENLNGRIVGWPSPPHTPPDATSDSGPNPDDKKD
jgi:hypothetical protein